MEKSRYGVSLAAISVISFILAYFGQLILLGLVLGYAILAEKNKWFSKQVFQAFYLRLGFLILTTILTFLFNIAFGFLDLFSHVIDYRILDVFRQFRSFTFSFVDWILIACVIWSIIKVAKGKDADLPLFGKLADKSLES